MEENIYLTKLFDYYENKLHLEEKERKIKKLLNNISEKEIKEEILDLI